MTLGQRIAQKRKELGLSQEGLGEQLKVSRQAIYKWESDTTLPEIEKLVAMSRIFSVPVGWLLGVEDGSGEPEKDSEGQLTEEQLHMVQEIVDRYLEARPQPELPRRRRWPFVLAGLVLVVVFVSLFSRLSELKQQYSSLQYSISNVTSSVNRDIASIADRVEEVLKSQNDLTAEYGSELLGADLAENTVTFRVWAIPRVYEPGMSARFTARSGDEPVSVSGAEEDGRKFTAEITCALTDEILLSVCFETGQEEKTQILDEYGSLYTESFAWCDTSFPLWFSVKGETLEAGEVWAEEMSTSPGMDFGNGQQAQIQTMRVGLFRDQELVMWYTEAQQSRILNGQQVTQTVYLREEAVRLERGHTYCEAVVTEDQFGRTRLFVDIPVHYSEEEEDWAPVNSYSGSASPEGWTF